MIHFHKWSKWTDTPALSMPGLLFPRLPSFVVVGQERRCSRCGRSELRT